ncbi:hypothetical protein [Clostridium tagluense]|uniref:Uncharacterized protein n=1 Tax=Clostridium tagluense TaxID=360422 RepID=A0A401UUD3_9CLOT|nr:hypothetical protein [Clostridium tagluense]GCD13160.1 hypothetical protein Ctaglu_47830 [Clostridium tagluense]
MTSDIIKIVIGSSCIGVVSAGIITSFSNIIIKKKEAQFKIIDRLIDKKILAYDNVMNFISTTREMQITNNNQIVEDLGVDFDVYDKPFRYPRVLENHQIYEEWYELFINLYTNYSMWFNNDLLREINLFQDYMINMYNIVHEIKDKDLYITGIIIRQDFIDFSSNLEKLCFKFYSKQILKLKMENKEKWHKYKPNETKLRLSNTKLIKYKNGIENLKSS